MATDIKRVAGLPRGATRAAAGITAPGMGGSVVGCNDAAAKEENSDKTRTMTVQEEEAATEEWSVL